MTSTSDASSTSSTTLVARIQARAIVIPTDAAGVSSTTARGAADQASQRGSARNWMATTAVALSATANPMAAGRISVVLVSKSVAALAGVIGPGCAARSAPAQIIASAT